MSEITYFFAIGCVSLRYVKRKGNYASFYTTCKVNNTDWWNG